MKLPTRAALTTTLLLLFAGGVPITLTAGTLPAPSGPIVLEVTGRVRHHNSAGEAQFDRQMLEALGMAKLRTSTAWTEGVAEFEGVLAKDLLDAVGAEGDTVTATALNDYTITIPVEELRRYPVMLALKMDGQYLKIKDKGPIWVVYPRDQNKELQEFTY